MFDFVSNSLALSFPNVSIGNLYHTCFNPEMPAQNIFENDSRKTV